VHAARRLGRLRATRDQEREDESDALHGP
jgi:hypothetical protein